MATLIGGLALGSIYALVAIGMVLVYRTTGIVNFAQGELATIGGYAYVTASAAALSPPVALICALGGGLLAGVLFFFVTHVLLRGNDQLRLVVGTVALLTLVQGSARWLATDRPFRARPWLLPDKAVHLFGATLPANSIVTVATLALIAAALFSLFSFTVIGKAMASVAEDGVRSALVGIPIRRMLLLSWGLTGALAALAGVLISPVTGVFPQMGAQVFLAAVVGAVVGGLDSVAGALVGGLVVGVVQTFAVVAVGGAFRDLVVFALLLAFLVARPTGLFGSPTLRRV